MRARRRLPLEVRARRPRHPGRVRRRDVGGRAGGGARPAELDPLRHAEHDVRGSAGERAALGAREAGVEAEDLV